MFLPWGVIIDITAAPGAIAQGSAAAPRPLEPGSWVSLPPLRAGAALGHAQALEVDLPIPYPALQWQKRIKKSKREKLLFGSGKASGAAGDACLLRGRPVAKRQRQDVLDGGPAINPCILANPRLFLKVRVSNGSGEHWGWGELVWD